VHRTVTKSERTCNPSRDMCGPPSTIVSDDAYAKLVCKNKKYHYSGVNDTKPTRRRTLCLGV
jgi:hypothetical protein